MSEQSKKQQLLALIRANPFIAQQDLAGQLGLSRSAVAGYIAGLIRERKLLGRAYVLPTAPQRRPIVCVGAANLDRKLRSLDTLALGTSNPAVQSESFGGVARNIAENLARLGSQVSLLTAIGADGSGAALLTHAETLGIDTRGALRLDGVSSGTYTAVLDQDGDMVVALADMALYEQLDPAFIAARQAQFTGAALVAADLNLPLATVEAIVDGARRGEAPLVLVAVSEPKMARLPRDLSGVRLLILNAGELAARAGHDLADDAALGAAMRALQAQGARDVVVTRGAAGVLLTDGPTAPIVHLAAPQAEVVDVTGAGDAFAAAVCWSLAQDLGADDEAGAAGDERDGGLVLACRRGLQLSKLTVGTRATVHPDLGPDSLAAVDADIVASLDKNANTNTNSASPEQD
ncbi:winged helix-turn-helix transcriptional regulator [Massilia forsythiae]|uniref:Winged helix-turn-helix transcriptional regulator n=1 Tax=Massilia forsythiae TaxID=2728020 RepID=A0A7Z2VU20_9BURK|nr:carbohydrate kinase [Massilia forsythiae]QJD99163.1 winged helix-turn-helix transcriptional regulator [Massilia forsythiae]